MIKYGKLAATAALALIIGAGVATAAKADTTVIKMKFDDDSGDHYFEPAKVTINPGDTVVWLQDDVDNEHNVAAYPNLIPEGTEPFESQMMTRVGESWSMTFNQEGSYFYHCHPHEAAGMKGLIVVGRESLPEEFRKAKSGEMSHDHGDMKDMDHGDMDDMDHGDMKDMDHGEMKDMKHGDHHEGGHADKEVIKKKQSGHHGDDDDDGHHGHHD
jgi:plastocyanin